MKPREHHTTSDRLLGPPGGGPGESRRAFLAMAARGMCALCLAEGFGSLLKGFGPGIGALDALAEDQAPAPDSTAPAAQFPNDPFVAPARHWEALANGEIQCHICPNECKVKPGDRGNCRIKENQGGHYKTLVYGRIVSLNIDPIEKKPLNHFCPGSHALSLATVGCNINCQFCQNWQISQALPEEVEAVHVPPTRMAALAREKNIPIIAYTYSEPSVSYENMIDTAREAHALGVKNVIISNGHMLEKPQRELLEVLDAVKIDLKGFNPVFYHDTCRGQLQAVLDTLKRVHLLGKWLEIVVLVIPTLNDSPAECRRMCDWIVENLGPDVPVHFTRFHPNYKLRNLPSTPTRTLERNREIARKAGVRFAYVGNVPGHKFENTYCPGCGEEVISRYGFVSRNRMKNGVCPKCGQKIPGVWA